MTISISNAETILEKLGSHKRNADIIRYLSETPAQKISKIIAGTFPVIGKISRQAMSTRLSQMEKENILIKIGARAHTTYELNYPVVANEYLKIDYLLRKDSTYNHDITDNYTPNETYLLDEDVRQELRGISDSVIKPGDTINRVVFNRLMTDMSYASSKMEGNTYSLAETEELLENGIESKDKVPQDTDMIRNHGKAISYLIENSREIKITPTEIRGLHSLLSKNLLKNPDDEGAIRHGIIGIGRTSYKPINDPHALTFALEKICAKSEQILNPYEKSIFLMLQIPYLQPFIDVNKRTGRIASNIPLLGNMLCPFLFYGIDDDEYLKGMIAFYELNTPKVMQETYRKGYRAAADRYRTYHYAVTHSGENAKIEKEVDKLIKATIENIAKGHLATEEIDDFCRERIIHIKEGAERDLVLIQVKKSLNSMTDVKAISYGIPTRIYDEYAHRIEEAKQWKSIKSI